jgi:hypothetical protein
LISAWLVASLAAGLAMPGAALAGSSGRRNTAIGVTGLSAYELLRGHTTTGLVAGAGAAYAWKRASDARKAEKRRAQYARASRRRRYTYSRARYRSR